jgi:hypothetical protein
MTNPTSNYGWVLPTSTDLVTDLPADFDVALQGVDTRLKALNPSTTLGDIEYASATANTNTRLGIGTTGQVLAVSSGVPAWTTPAGSSTAIAQIASGTTTSGTSLSLTSLTAYDTLKFRITGITTAAAANWTATINSSSSAVYDYLIWGAIVNTTTYDGTELGRYQYDTADSKFPINVTRTTAAADTDNYVMIDLYNCKASGFTTFEMQSRQVTSLGAGYRQYSSSRGIFKTAAAVSSFQFNTSSAFSAGSYVLWGG